MHVSYVLGISISNPQGTEWKRVLSAFKHIRYVSCGALGCWRVSIGDQIWYRSRVSAQNCAVTSSWTPIGGSLKQIEVCNHYISHDRWNSMLHAVLKLFELFEILFDSFVLKGNALSKPCLKHIIKQLFRLKASFVIMWNIFVTTRYLVWVVFFVS